MLSGNEAHHAGHVVRLRVGDSAIVFDGQGSESVCTVVATERRGVRMRVDRVIRHEPAHCRIHLFQAITKGNTLDDIIEKSVELGVTVIRPLVTERVIARPVLKGVSNKGRKWRRTIIEAAKQCGQCWLPTLKPPALFEEALESDRHHDLRLVASLGPDASHIRALFDHYLDAHGRLPGTVSVWIGPEGGFAPSELERLVQCGVQSFTFGELVLRCETASVSALAILQQEIRWRR